ncbi:MAG: ABC transporter ATP-binding protein [Anaerolineae bacterium]
MADITLSKVTKKFGDDVVAVKDLDLHIDDGEFLVLLGPSGCGKTTTLRIIAGLETQTSGDIHIGDRLVNDLRAGDRDIAFVFQFYALYPHLSVKDNISFPLRAQKVPKAEVERRVRDVTERLRISHLLKSRPNRLPGGEQQRVALGRAMVRQPQVFLMDEPLTNLDAALRSDMRAELKHLQQDLGTTMVYVTHDQVEAMSMSHRIAVLNLGVLQQVDTPLNIYRHPETLFVATFIGSPPMNIIRANVTNHTVYSADNAVKYILPEYVHDATKTIKQVHFGIRAEDIHIVHSTDDDADFQGEVRLREPLGDETIYRIDVGKTSFAVTAPPKVMLQRGDHVRLKLNPKRIHLFDVQTEHSLLTDKAVVHV